MRKFWFRHDKELALAHIVSKWQSESPNSSLTPTSTILCTKAACSYLPSPASKLTVFLMDFYCMPTRDLTVSIPRRFLNCVLMYFLASTKNKRNQQRICERTSQKERTAITISLILPLLNFHLHLCSSSSKVFPASRVIQHNGQGIRLECKSSCLN